MEFTVSSALLSQQLTAISGVITRNPIVPILENFLFQITHNHLVVTASDLQTSISAALAIQSDAQVSVAIPARMLLDTVKNLSEQPIKLEINPNSYTVSIKSDNGQYKLAGESANDFPLLTTLEDGIALEVEVDVLKNILQKTIFATSNDELKPAMSGVYIDFTQAMATFVATDGHRLVRYIREDVTVSAQSPIIVPKKALMLLNGLISSRDKQVGFTFDRHKIQFSIDNISVVTRLVDERYPDYENVIPKEHTSKLTVNKPALVSALKRVAIYANKATHQVKLTLITNELTISAEDLDFSNEAQENLICIYEGLPLEIGFNAKLLLDMLASIATEEVEFFFWGANKAVLIFPKAQNKQEHLLLLIMPIIF
ncbi:DNA polymerase III subunit beta [Cardinium endosymbiont cEper1 of Encarsia pergandiella]|uniref:DNA polymerase III subunit beta n=1 Tax=Cardinium endosymbiont of Encarsia pergandiella TaxID=249402 RepID=UPI00027E9B12|nr:DNA polymerase III subunit beta [Cardinium endosymbiont of Encarsia pergandiella]CCM10555.1 DNA polymerase III subunit beta [Cardinium endosymbiont cEper1 of Encarsia pergandiella]